MNATPTLRDRELANELLGRVLATFHTNKPDPGSLGAIRMLAVEAEIAIATARIEERERCAKVAEDYCKAFDIAPRGASDTSKAIALMIRNPVDGQ